MYPSWKRAVGYVLMIALGVSVVAIHADFLSSGTAHAAGDVPSMGSGRSWYVAPDGSAAGDGSLDHPWDILTALQTSGGGKIGPGDTVWLHAGRYKGDRSDGTDAHALIESRLVGTAQNPIYVRAYPGERAIIDAWLQVGCCDQDPQPSKGAYVQFWDLEFAGFNPDRSSGTSGPPEWAAQANHPAIDSWAPGAKFVDNIVHDTAGGISLWKESANAEAYGNLIYYVGGTGSDRGHGHGFYAQNAAPAVMKIFDNVSFNNFGEGYQMYGSGDQGYVQNFDMEGNVGFNNGSVSAGRDDDIVLGGGVNGPSGITLKNNYFYETPDTQGGYADIGYLWTPRGHDLTATGNYFIGGQYAVDFIRWDNLTFTGNTIYSKDNTEVMLAYRNDQNLGNYQFADNHYYGSGKFLLLAGCESWPCSGSSDVNWNFWPKTTGLDTNSTFTSGAPSGVWKFVRPNAYEPGRANLVVYNWDHAGQVSFSASDLAALGLQSGASYQIRDAENFFGPPVASGNYDGNSVTVPMQNLAVAALVGNPASAGSVFHPQSHTAPEFGVFVLLSGPALSGTAAGTGPVVTPPATVPPPASGVGTATTPAIIPAGTGTSTSPRPGAITATSETTTNPSSPPSGSAQPFSLTLEAEAGSLAGAMSTSSDAAASNGIYVSSGVDGNGTASYTFTVPADGNYTVWARVLAPDADHDSFYISMDGGQEDIYDVAEGTWSSHWQWTTVNGRGSGGTPLALNPRTFSLSAGTHTLTFRGREIGSKLDMIAITNDPNFAPPAPVSAPTPPPVSSAGASSVSAPIIADFFASPWSVASGKPVTLQWRVFGADTVTITGLGAVSSTGSVTLMPTTTAFYDLSASNTVGAVSGMAAIIVIP